MDGAGAPNEKGAGAPPNARGIAAGGNAMLDASPDVYPVSMVDVGESIPKLAPPSAIGLLGNDGVAVGVEADAAPNIKGAGALDPPKEKAGVDSAPGRPDEGAGAALPNENGGIVYPAVAASGFEAGAPNMKGAGAAFALGAAAVAPKVKAGTDSELDGVGTLAGGTEPKVNGAGAATGVVVGTDSDAAAGAPNDIDGVAVEDGVVEGAAPKVKLDGAGDEVTAGAVARAEGGKPNERPTGFLISPITD